MYRRRNIIKAIKHNYKLSLLLVIAAIILFFAAIYFVLSFVQDRANDYGEVSGGGFVHKMPNVVYNGQKYRYKTRLENILLMGVDSHGDIYDEDISFGGGQADAIFVMSIDHSNKQINYIQINRDIVTTINVTDADGNPAGTSERQICLAYAFGDGKEKSCENVSSAVSNLLYSVPMDEYYSMNLDGIAVLNDSVGGVSVKVEDDFTGIDDTLVKGQRVTLMGEHATNFVRTRREIGEGKNVDRMRRQREYLNSFKAAFRRKIEGNPEFAVEMDEDISSYRVSSMKLDELADLFIETEDYQSNDIVELSGDIDYSGRFVEVTPRDDEIRELVMNTFYEPAE